MKHLVYVLLGWLAWGGLKRLPSCANWKEKSATPSVSEP